MYKLDTTFQHFRFNSIHNHGPFHVIWYKYLEKGPEGHGECFNHEELQQLTNYVAGNGINFTRQNYHSCNNDEVPVCTAFDLIPSQLNFPKNLIISSNLQLSTQHNIYHCMNIELLTINGISNHSYNLEFDIIGEII